MGFLIRHAEINGTLSDCRVDDGRVSIVAKVAPRRRGDVEIDARGGALVAGLADHHIHLLSLAARRASLDLGSTDNLAGEIRAAARASRGGWVRATGWDERRHGQIDRDLLDVLAPDVPVKVEHRSGAAWVLNSVALAAAGHPAGVERGIVYRADIQLRDRLPVELPSLAEVGRELAAYGITHVTDASPQMEAQVVAHLAGAGRAGDLPQHLNLLGDAAATGAYKLVVSDHQLPDPDQLAHEVAVWHARGRAVAVHCVSREALALTINALETAGVLPGDRIEHCALADASAVAQVRRLGVAVVTQPTFIALRGDGYLAEHAEADYRDLWRYGSLLGAGVPTVASSDAPYGDPDPWATMRAARDRRTPSGFVVGPDERVEPASVLIGLHRPLDNLTGPTRVVKDGVAADLVLLRSCLADALAEPVRNQVTATFIAGRLVYSAG